MALIPLLQNLNVHHILPAVEGEVNWRDGDFLSRPQKVPVPPICGLRIKGTQQLDEIAAESHM